MKKAAIIKDVIKTHHGYLKEALPEIERLAYTIYRVHFDDNGDLLEKVYRLFSNLKTTLEVHIIKEERGLFYMIMDYEEEASEELLNEIQKGIKEIEADFALIESILEELRETTNNYVLPASSCTTFGITYNKLEELEADLTKHMEIEKTQIFQI